MFCPSNSVDGSKGAGLLNLYKSLLPVSRVVTAIACVVAVALLAVAITTVVLNAKGVFDDYLWNSSEWLSFENILVNGWAGSVAGFGLCLIGMSFSGTRVLKILAKQADKQILSLHGRVGEWEHTGNLKQPDLK